jgi:hypothetical protein
VWAAVSADKGILDLGGLSKGGTETPQWTNDAWKSLASDGAAAGARNPDEMMVTVAWTWTSRRSNGHSVTQQSVQDDNTRYTDDVNNRTIMADTVASKAGEFTANSRYERGDGWFLQQT